MNTDDRANDIPASKNLPAAELRRFVMVAAGISKIFVFAMGLFWPFHNNFAPYLHHNHIISVLFAMMPDKTRRRGGGTSLFVCDGTTLARLSTYIYECYLHGHQQCLIRIRAQPTTTQTHKPTHTPKHTHQNTSRQEAGAKGITTAFSLRGGRGYLFPATADTFTITN